MKTYRIIGVMSGTSLDGLDIACCDFKQLDGKWHYHIACADTIPYPVDWFNNLAQAHTLPAHELIRLDQQYGKFIGQTVQAFIRKYNLKQLTCIASHGHTVFHRPQNGFTLQIGHGAAIHAETGIAVICDFRSLDVALGGQGAPLVPIGDELLFSNYGACLNLGGFANISYTQNQQRMAFDIGPCNILLNQLAALLRKSYDAGGEEARKGMVNADLLHRLNALDYYKQPAPKSTGREWFEAEVLPIFASSQLNVNDQLATAVKHIAHQLNSAIQITGATSVLITGGGAFNTFLIEQLNASRCVIPDKLSIHYKEALVFALLGLLRIINEPNALSSVTGAHMSSVGGALWGCIVE